MAEQSPSQTPVRVQVGHYQIRRKIGAGGMGVVYKGWDERLGRAVAIKTVHEASKSGDARSRLWREARSLARVSHPGICQIFDVIEDDKDLFLVLELLGGQSLADRIASGPIITPEAVSIERQILEGRLVQRHSLVEFGGEPGDAHCMSVLAGLRGIDCRLPARLARAVRRQGPGH